MAWYLLTIFTFIPKLLTPVTASYLVPADNFLVNDLKYHDQGTFRSGKGNMTPLKRMRSLHEQGLKTQRQRIMAALLKSRGKHGNQSMTRGTLTPLILTEDGKIKGKLALCIKTVITC